MVVEKNETVTVKILVTSFSKVSHTDNGGVLHIINAGFTCSKTTFTECSSTEIGGAIYLSYTHNNQNSYTLDGLSFNKCSSKCGGSIYVHSTSMNNEVKISGCTFTGNVALSKSDTLGGISIFMSIKSGLIKSNTFVNNVGDSVVKILNDFQATKLNVKESHEFDVLVSDCKFDNFIDSKSCIYNLLGNGESSFEVKVCILSGVLSQVTHCIDGKSIANDGPKLVVKQCKFDFDLKDAFNLESGDNFLSVDINDQIFNHPNDKNEHKPKSSWKIIVAATVPVVVIVVVIIVV